MSLTEYYYQVLLKKIKSELKNERSLILRAAMKTDCYHEAIKIARDITEAIFPEDEDGGSSSLSPQKIFKERL